MVMVISGISNSGDLSCATISPKAEPEGKHSVSDEVHRVGLSFVTKSWLYVN